MPMLSNELICSTPYIEGQDPPDALGLSKHNYWDIHRCIVDLTNWPMDKEDEAVGITWGASATFTDCVIRGAAKNILCGCGDDEKVPVEKGKRVTFDHCIIEDFCRRGPEVQDGMECIMRHCLIRNWGRNAKFDTRAFGGWAHKGGTIYAEDCIFINDNKPTFANNIRDHWHHFWQCMKERGLFGLFHRDAYMSGYRRALTTGPDGSISAYNCYAGDGLVIDGHVGAYMTEARRNELFSQLCKMREELGIELDWNYPKA